MEELLESNALVGHPPCMPFFQAILCLASSYVTKTLERCDSVYDIDLVLSLSISSGLKLVSNAVRGGHHYAPTIRGRKGIASLQCWTGRPASVLTKRFRAVIHSRGSPDCCHIFVSGGSWYSLVVNCFPIQCEIVYCQRLGFRRTITWISSGRV